VNKDHSNNYSILGNLEVDDDMKLKDITNSDADGSLEDAGETVYSPKKNPDSKKLDTRSSEAKDSIETKSMNDENVMELDECK